MPKCLVKKGVDMQKKKSANNSCKRWKMLKQKMQQEPVNSLDNPQEKIPHKLEK